MMRTRLNATIFYRLNGFLSRFRPCPNLSAGRKLQNRQRSLSSLW